MDRVVCSQEDGSGSGSGSGGWICKGSTPDLTVNNKAFVHPPPSITLPQVFTPPHKRHTLLSPLPSRPGTPSPLRHTTPTLTLTPVIATAHLPPDSLLFDTSMPIYQPRPQHATLSPTISPSASQSQHRPVTPTRPSSRSEKLLRETLMRDQERPPMPTSPYATSTISPSAGRSPNPRHRRRHSEVPPMNANGRTRSQEEERQEELARGAMMFRTPMMTASPRSPSPYAAHDSSNLSRRHSQTQHQHHQHHHHGAASQHSHSPSRSPVLARRSSIKSQQSSQHQQPRHASPGISRQRVPHPLPLGPESLYHQTGEPVMRTPHEQVLRARLERVLQSGSKPAAGPKPDVFYEDSSPPADDEQESSESSESLDEDENVVRDENGTRAWRRDVHPSPQAPSSSHRKGMASPPSSSTSGSGSARSDSRERLNQRARSSTVPDFPVTLQQQHPTSPYPSHPTPRRSTTAPNAAALKRQPQPQHHHHRGRHAPSGTTPPLVSDGSPTPPEDDEDRESDEMRLLTPPSTPPSHLATYNHQAFVAAYSGAYAPSPYYTKTAFSATEQRSGNGFGGGRTLEGRGRPPLRGLGPAMYDEDDDDEDEDDSVSGSGSSFYEEGEGYYCSSGSCSSCSGSGCSSCVRYIHKQLPTNPMQHHALPHHHHQLQQQQQLQRQQQFNVRRASARCREMEGYVSFSAVEGLGAPPESESGEENAENAQKEAAGKKGGVGGWVRRLLGSEGGNGPVVV